MSAQQRGHLWRELEHFLQVTKCPQGMKTIAMSLSMHTLQSFSRCSFSSFFKGSSAESHKKGLYPDLLHGDVTSVRTDVCKKTALTLSFLTHIRITIKRTTGYVLDEIFHRCITLTALTDPFQNGPFHLNRIKTQVDSFLANLWLQYIWCC